MDYIADIIVISENKKLRHIGSYNKNKNENDKHNKIQK